MAELGRLAKVLIGVTVGGCAGDPGAALEVTDARATRTAEQRIAVDIDLLARESLGGNVGTYCVRVIFGGQPEPREECAADLEDGDTKTMRLLSDGYVPPGAAIQIRVRLGATDVGRALAAPP